MKSYWARFFKEASGAYSVDVPDLPGCFTCGDTFEEAYGNLVEEAMPLWLEGVDCPAPSGPDAILAAPAHDGASKPILVRATVDEGPESLAEALARAAQNDLVARAARAYLARLNGGN